MTKKELTGTQSACPHCNGVMELECRYDEIVLKDYSYWWGCTECGRVYDEGGQLLLFRRTKEEMEYVRRRC